MKNTLNTNNKEEKVAVEVAKKIRLDPFSGENGIELLEIRPGYAKTEMAVGENMMNFNGVTHGAAVFAVADAAFAAASNSHGKVALALNINISYLKATQAGTKLTAVAVEENLTRRTALYRITVHDDGEDLVAVAQGLVYRKNETVVKEEE